MVTYDRTGLKVFVVADKFAKTVFNLKEKKKKHFKLKKKTKL